MELPTLVDAIDDHARHLADAAARIFLHDLLHIADTSLGVAVVEAAQSADEQEFVAVRAQWESRLADAGVGSHFVEAIFLERLVGGRIE